jgi:hypothetical protein
MQGFKSLKKTTKLCSPYAKFFVNDEELTSVNRSFPGRQISKLIIIKKEKTDFTG